ncbi:MAG TPA: hypothetical protein VG100_11265 [Xanthobacteraceae bacterium]|jgi:hypothetical protein|nr:hypothetical protein [Xanthobacteraceae bacterium]
MPRYYFNIMDGRPVVDREGIDLPDAAAARKEATRYAIDLVRRQSELRGWNEVENVVVTDERGAEVLTVTFPKSAVERCT